MSCLIYVVELVSKLAEGQVFNSAAKLDGLRTGKFEILWTVLVYIAFVMNHSKMVESKADSLHVKTEYQEGGQAWGPRIAGFGLQFARKHLEQLIDVFLHHFIENSFDLPIQHARRHKHVVLRHQISVCKFEYCFSREADVV